MYPTKIWSVRPPEPDSRGDPKNKGDPLNKGDPSNKVNITPVDENVDFIFNTYVKKSKHTAVLIVDEQNIIVGFKSNLQPNYLNIMLKEESFLKKNMYDFYKHKHDVERSKKLLDETRKSGEPSSMEMDVVNIFGFKRLKVRATKAPVDFDDTYLIVYASPLKRLKHLD